MTSLHGVGSQESPLLVHTACRRPVIAERVCVVAHSGSGRRKASDNSCRRRRRVYMPCGGTASHAS